METLAIILPILRKGTWATSIDLKDAYPQVMTHDSCLQFLVFSHIGKDYIFRALPFGLSIAPRVFTSVASATVVYLMTPGASIFAYLEDWLITGEPKRQAEGNVSLTLDTLAHLGWIVNLSFILLTLHEKPINLSIC